MLPFRGINRSACFEQRNAPRTLTAMTSSQHATIRVPNALAKGDTCIVHENIDTSELVSNELDCALNFVFTSGRPSIRQTASSNGGSTGGFVIKDDNACALLLRSLEAAAPIPEPPPVMMATLSRTLTRSEAFPNVGGESPGGPEADALIQLDRFRISGRNRQTDALAVALRSIYNDRLNSSYPTPWPLFAGATQTCVTWPVSAATRLARTIPAIEPSARSATNDAGMKKLPQPGYCTML